MAVPHIYIYLHLNVQANPSNYHSIQGNITSEPHSVSPSSSLRLRGLAQARRARSGEPPPRLGEGSKGEQEHMRDLA